MNAVTLTTLCPIANMLANARNAGAGDDPAVYVGTFGKYASGSICGSWLSLEAFGSHDDFMAACLLLHSDETDPEIMFQDYQNFPKSFYSESHISPEVWDWMTLTTDEKDILEAYQDNIDPKGDISEALDAYHGTYDTPTAWAENYLNDTGSLDRIPENLRYYFDFHQYARDQRHSGMVFAEVTGGVMVFSN